LILLQSKGQISDYKDAALMIDTFGKAKVLLTDRAMTPTGSAIP